MATLDPAEPLPLPASGLSSRIATGRLLGAATALTLADTDGQLSSFRIGESGKLQWWLGGKCKAKSIKALTWGPATAGEGESEGGSEGEEGFTVLSTWIGQPRITVVDAGQPLADLKLALLALAEGAGTPVLTEAALAGLKGKTSGRRQAHQAPGATVTHGSHVSQRRWESEAALIKLTPPNKGDCAAVREPPAGMEAALEELRHTSHAAPAASGGGGSGSNADGALFSGIDWPELPPHLSMTAGLEPGERGEKKGDAERFARKQRQCDAFAAAIAALDLPDGTVVADFGCGSCGLTLPLAWAFPRLSFIGVDLKQKALELMSSRAAAAGARGDAALTLILLLLLLLFFSIVFDRRHAVSVPRTHDMCCTQASPMYALYVDQLAALQSHLGWR